MTDMADVLAELDAHMPTHSEYTGGWWELACTGCDFAKGRRLSHLDWTPHHAHRVEIFAAALSAAGFGPVREALDLQQIADVIMSRVIYAGNEGWVLTAEDRDDHEYAHCLDAAQAINQRKGQQ